MPFKNVEVKRAYHSKYHKKWYTKNRVKRQAQIRAWFRTHPGKSAEHQRTHYRRNRAEEIAMVRQWEKDNPEKLARRLARYKPRRQIISWKHKLQRYGLTLLDYRKLLGAQNNRCGICGITYNESIKRYRRAFDVDHDHSTGAVRGLLCMKCNGAIGLFADNITSLQRAIIYLNRIPTSTWRF